MKAIKLAIACLFVVSQVAYAGTKITGSGGPDVDTARDDLHQGLKARIIVGKFTDKTTGRGYYREEFGRGLSDMLTTALFQTNRFAVLERETIEIIRAEGGQVVPADIMVVAAITGFEPEAGGVTTDIFGSKWAKKLKKLKGFADKAKVAMDLRLVDLRTSQIVAATSVKASATVFGIGGAGGSDKLSGALSAFKKTPMETAIRKMITKAVGFVVVQTPDNYYRH